MEEDRHTFQRDTLLELQNELQRLVRITAQISLQDQRTIKAQGQMYLLGRDLSDEATRLMVSVCRLRSRVVDDQLRAEVGEFTDLCAASGLVSARTVRIANAYGQLIELLGVHLRRELDRRFLVAPDHRV